MHETIVIRPYRPADHAAIRTLHDRTPPAGRTATAAQSWPPDLDRIAASYQAFWVAVNASDPDEPVVGMVGVQPPGGEVPAAVLCGRQGIVQLKRMRVAPERQRQGIGRRLLAFPFRWAFAPDVPHKTNVSGGPPVGVTLPAPEADGIAGEET